jgi:hypothetical protein
MRSVPRFDPRFMRSLREPSTSRFVGAVEGQTLWMRDAGWVVARGRIDSLDRGSVIQIQMERARWRWFVVAVVSSCRCTWPSDHRYWRRAPTGPVCRCQPSCDPCGSTRTCRAADRRLTPGRHRCVSTGATTATDSQGKSRARVADSSFTRRVRAPVVEKARAALAECEAAVAILTSELGHPFAARSSDAADHGRVTFDNRENHVKALVPCLNVVGSFSRSFLLCVRRTLWPLAELQLRSTNRWHRSIHTVERARPSPGTAHPPGGSSLVPQLGQH